MIDIVFFFFFNDTATTEIYTLSLHDALPISQRGGEQAGQELVQVHLLGGDLVLHQIPDHGEQHCDERDDGEQQIERQRSEEHTSELQSQSNIVCRLLLEKKKTLAICTDVRVL